VRYHRTAPGTIGGGRTSMAGDTKRGFRRREWEGSFLRVSRKTAGRKRTHGPKWPMGYTDPLKTDLQGEEAREKTPTGRTFSFTVPGAHAPRRGLKHHSESKDIPTEGGPMGGDYEEPERKTPAKQKAKRHVQFSTCCLTRKNGERDFWQRTPDITCNARGSKERDDSDTKFSDRSNEPGEEPQRRKEIQADAQLSWSNVKKGGWGESHRQILAQLGAVSSHC